MARRRRVIHHLFKWELLCSAEELKWPQSVSSFPFCEKSVYNKALGMLSSSFTPEHPCPAVLRGLSDQDSENIWKLKLEVESAEVLQGCGTMGLLDWRLFGRVRTRARLKSAPWGLVGFFYFSRWICHPWAKRALVTCRSHLGGSPVCLLSLLMLALSAWSGRGS